MSSPPFLSALSLAQADVRLAEPTPRQLLVAAELRLAGHRDLFD